MINLGEEMPRFGEIVPGEAANVPMRAHDAIPGIELAGILALRVLNLGRHDTRGDRADDVLRDLVLDGKHIGQFAIVALRPEVVAARRID